MSSFQPAVDEQLVIDDVVYQVCAHPTSPSTAYVQRGQEGQVVQLRTAGGYVALKVVRAPLAGPDLLRHAAELEQLAAIAGLQAARRLVLDPQRYAGLMAAQPLLSYAVLMPWVYGPSWRDVLRTRRAVTPDQARQAAQQLAQLLSELERRGLAHADLQSANLLLPGLDVETPDMVALIDLERLHGNGIHEMAVPVRPAEGYGHHALGETMGPLRDRFAGALLIAELLAWSEPEVRNAASGESYFEDRDLHQSGARSQLLRDALLRRAGPQVVALFDRAWNSATLAQCPRFTEWAAALSVAQPAPFASSAAAPAPAAVAAATVAYAAPAASADATQLAPGAAYPQPYTAPDAAYREAQTQPYTAPAAVEATAAVSFETLAGFAQSLKAQGRFTEAAAALRHALSTLPPTDPRHAQWQYELRALEERAGPPQSYAPVAAPAPAPRRRAPWVLPVIGGLLLLLVLVIAGIAAILLSNGNQLSADQPPTGGSSAAVLPTRAPTAAPSSSSSPSPSAAVVAGVTVLDVAPTELYSGDSRLAFIVRGDGLDTIKDAALVAADGLRLPLVIGAGSSAAELRLSLPELPAGFSGSRSLTLELDGTVQPAATLVLRDFLEERQVIGVRSDYAATGRIATDAFGPFVTIHTVADVNSPQTGSIRADDTLQILSVAAEGWYQVRVAAAVADPARVGQVGFVERWLVDNTNVPTPAPTSTPAEARRLRFVKLNENDNPNCISVAISGIRTSGWSFTIDGTNNVGRFDAGGNARVCGLATQQEVTLTVRDENGRPVPGGSGVPARGSAIMGATWQ